ncbi:MAG: uroporphyrinogen decarboxylase family protein [Candidatus Latescibacteria bacterium]|jgi:uroporphyrinogen decarboxylase|nr:uroporphyrinogen decarboxylase family protein [Candidatus Latescibacterota bacterium]
MMTSKERMLCALQRGVPDRVPYCEVGVSAQVIQGLSGEVANDHMGGGIDEMDNRGPDTEIAVSQLLHRDNICYRMQQPVPVERQVGADNIPYYLDGPVKSKADLDLIALPDPEDEALWEPARAFLASAGDYATCMVTRVGISACYLAMGMETFSIALHEDRSLVEAVMERYSEWSSQIARRASDLGFDFLWTSDDLAFKTGPLMSPQMFREIFLPHMRRVADAVSIPWVFHSDGDLTALLPDFMDLGISALNPIEPGAMDIVEVKKNWGHQICVIGNVDVHLLATGSPDQVSQEVRRLLQKVGTDGGYIMSSGNSLASYCKPENVRAMIETLQTHGTYPIQTN